MSRRTFATVDTLLVAICIVIFAGGVLAQGYASGNSTGSTKVSDAGDRR